MRSGFSFNREFDFVRLSGLRRATGRPPHEWDIYIIKELVDNALDADDVLWEHRKINSPALRIEIEYVHIPEHQSGQFHVQESNQFYVDVSNQALFPVDQIEDIFNTQWYTSRKSFIKGLTRGALGNALKTVLGIPYALRNREAGNWSPDVKPLSIYCGDKEYLPRFVIDSPKQTIQFEYDQKQAPSHSGTKIHVGMEHFEQEVSRTLEDIQLLAEHYRLCNPHAEFSWHVELHGSEWSVEYPGNHTWRGKIQERSPIQWYSERAFKDLLGALYRKEFGNGEQAYLPGALICAQFCGLSQADLGRERPARPLDDMLRSHGLDQIRLTDIEGDIGTRLYRMLIQNSPEFDSQSLGVIGSEHIGSTLREIQTISGKVIYDVITDEGKDLSTPFVLEAAITKLQQGKRQILTAINFTPTYTDPFLSRKLIVAINPEDSVLGIRGMLDAYGLTEDVSVAFFLHLICPNVEHHEFSKTEINHLPFRVALADLIDDLFNEYENQAEAEERRIEQAIFRALDAILDELLDDERFVFDQLVQNLLSRLDGDAAMIDWLKAPDALQRLQSHVNNYQSQNAILYHRVARPSAGLLALPLHPNGHISISAEHLSRQLLARHYVNKLLYVQVRELEPVVMDNNWLCRMDMAMLCNSPTSAGLQDVLIQCIVNSESNLLVLHDADEEGRLVVDQMRTWLSERQLDPGRILDLGLSVEDSGGPSRLIEMMPNELVSWLVLRMNLFGVQIKSMPNTLAVRKDIRERFEHLLLGHVWEGLAEQTHMTHLMSELDLQFGFSTSMRDERLDERIVVLLEQQSPSESYSTVLQKVVEEFFRGFMVENVSRLHAVIQRHLADVKNSWNA